MKMKKKSKRGIAAGILSFILAIVCAAVYFRYHELRFLIGSALLVVLAAMNFIRRFSGWDILEELEESADERDIYLAMRSSHISARILNYVLYTVFFINIVLYGVFKSTIFITVAGTLCVVLMLTFIVFLCVNHYLEKHE